jgi:HAMP domain-containing protein
VACGKTYGIDFSSIDENTKIYCRYCEQPIELKLKLNHSKVEKKTRPPDFVEKPSQKEILSIKNTPKIKSKKRVTLRKKFNIVLITIMLFSISVSIFASGYILNKSAQNNVVNNARLLLTTVEASDSFTSNIAHPALLRALPGKYVVEVMSSAFSTRSVFEKIKEKYPEFYFKQAVINPRNRKNLADTFETRIIEQFANNPQKKEWLGYRDINGDCDFIILKPIVAEEKCMRCHSRAEKAPQEIVDRYGDKAAFGMIVGEVVGALSISVPATEVFQKARKNVIIINSIFLFCFASLIIIINLFFQRIIIKPLYRLSNMVGVISAGNTAIKIETNNNDEINDLAKGIELMRTSINLALKRLGRGNGNNRHITLNRKLEEVQG